MKISLSPNQLFDIVGFPLVSGRVSVYLHDSDTLATTYTLNGQDFVEAENPITLTNTGEFLNTIFMDAAIYDIVVEQLVDGVYAQVKDFNFGFDMPKGNSDTLVDGVAALADANPALGSVTVVGYNSSCPSGPHTYVWDPTCTDNADGGCIIASNTTEDGRWILCSDLIYMPCSYYGITPGHEGNLSAFLTYPETVGQWGIHMPPIPRFLPGTYTSQGNFSVTKPLYFDKGAKFTQASFTCKYVEAVASNSYHGNFTFTDTVHAVAYLSWFRTRPAFRDCGAKIVYIDADYTTDSANVTLSGKEMHYTMTPPAWMSIQNCIQIVSSAGLMDATHVSAAGDLSVGRYFLIEPHDDLMNPYYEIYSQGNLSYPTMRLQDNQCVLFHNGITVHEGIDIPGRTVNGTYYPQQWWGYFDDGEDGPTVQIKAKGDIEVTNLKGNLTATNLTATNASIGTLNVTSEAKISKLMGRNYDFIPLFSGFVRSYTVVDLNWTSYGSHILPTTVPADALIKIHMTWAWNDSSSVPISDYIHLSGASGRSFGDVIALENCGPQSASFTFSDMYRNGDAETIADHAGPIYVIDMSLNLIDVIPPFERHSYMYNGSGWERVSV